MFTLSNHCITLLQLTLTAYERCELERQLKCFVRWIEMTSKKIAPFQSFMVKALRLWTLLHFHLMRLMSGLLDYDVLLTLIKVKYILQEGRKGGIFPGRGCGLLPKRWYFPRKGDGSFTKKISTFQEGGTGLYQKDWCLSRKGDL